MPEGHTIHRLATDQAELLVGSGPIAVSSPQGRFAEQAALVDGVDLERIEAYGKHLFYWWANDLVGHVHLGLFGRFRTASGDGPPDPVGAVRMRMSTGRATVDLSGPTVCEIGDEAARDAVIARLGPDPLRDDADSKVAIARIGRSRLPIGALLLDQRVIAGLGNAFRAEVLFVNGIHPCRPGVECSVDDVEAIWDTSVSMLRRGFVEDRIITVDPALVPPGPPRRGDATLVYHRDRCLRCGTAIQIVELGGRACYFCPCCQPS